MNIRHPGKMQYMVDQKDIALRKDAGYKDIGT